MQQGIFFVRTQMTNDDLKERRVKLGLTQGEMATALNANFRTYQGWEQKRTIPSHVEVALQYIEANPPTAKKRTRAKKRATK